MKLAVILVCMFAALLTLLMLASCVYKAKESAKAKKTIYKIKEREAEKRRNGY